MQDIYILFHKIVIRAEVKILNNEVITIKKIGFGCIGIGQGGINLAKEFNEHFPTIVIDTAKQNLDSCNVEEDLKLHVKINEWGGAGKNIELGEQGIIEYQQEITNLIESNFSDLDYIWVTAGLGGGTGSLGCVQISNILNNLGITHGMLVTLPANHEGDDEFINATTALYSIEKARSEFNNLRSIIIIENEKLKERIMNNFEVSFENLWKKANKYVFNSFYKLFKYSQKSSSFTFDGQDYIRILEKSGYMTFSEKIIKNVEEKSENVLVNEVQSIWREGVFMDQLDFNKAKGLALIINRPKSYDQDGRAINNLLSEMNEFIGNGTFCPGIYESEKGFTETIKRSFDKNKSIKLITAISGIPFPEERFKELKEKSELSIDAYYEQDQDSDINLNLGKISTYVNEYKRKKETTNFSIFDEPKKKQINAANKLQQTWQEKLHQTKEDHPEDI
ncbi:MAG: hypothetical protein ACQEQI_00375 [Bacillota bacterium]